MTPHPTGMKTAQPPENGSGPALPPGRSSAMRKLGAAGIIAAGLALLVAIYALGLTPDQVTDRDYIQYWAAARQLTHHSHPYNVAAIFALERQNGMRADDPKVSLSPPVALELMLPLGWMSAKTGLIVWLIAELAALLASIALLWRLCGRPDTRLHLLGLAFAPAVACQMAGQIGAFFLLGLVLFLALYPSRPWLAGAALMPFALKPHLFGPFAIALLIGCVARRSYALVAGGLAALAVSCAASVLIDPHAWAQYANLTSSVSMLDWQVPTVAGALRHWLNPAARWIAFVPEALGCAWAAWYAWKRRATWNWMRQGQLVMLVSVACAPYSWISDQCLLLPAVLAVLLTVTGSRLPLLLFLVIDAAMLAEIFVLPKMTSNWFVWTAPAWLAWYLFAARQTNATGVANRFTGRTGTA